MDQVAQAPQQTSRGDAAPVAVYLLDDHELVRLGLMELWEGEGFTVVGTTGAAGYVMKEIDGTDLLTSLRRTANGKTLFNPDIVKRIVQGIADPSRMDPWASNLTPQELRVLTLMGRGLSNGEIGVKMFLAEKTIKNYVSSLLAKLGFAPRTRAAVFSTGTKWPNQPDHN